MAKQSHMKRTLFRRALLVLALAAGASLFACSQSDRQPAGSPERVTLACASPPYTLLADIALANGYFRQQGLEVTPHFHSTGKAALDQVLVGKADFATVAETPVMLAVMNGSTISVIATIQSSSRNDAVLARKDRGVHAPKDLKGKRIAASLGTIGEYYLDAFLATHGMAREDVKVVNLKPEEMPAALADGQVDAASAFRPFLNQAEQKLGDTGITFYEDDIYTQTFNLVATQEYVRGNPGTVRKMLLALIEAGEFVARHPDEAQKAVAGFRQMDKSVLGGILAGNTFDVSLDQSLLLALEDESRWAIRNGLTKATKVPNYLAYIYFDGLKSVKPAAVRIPR